jgi:hypothetical protein
MDGGAPLSAVKEVIGHPVRLKVSAYPDHIFRGRVAKIGGESETDQNNRGSYRVEFRRSVTTRDDVVRANRGWPADDRGHSASEAQAGFATGAVDDLK